MPEPIVDFLFTPHAIEQMRRRGIDEALVGHVLARPQQRRILRRGLAVLQSIVDTRYLVRVIVDLDRSPPEIVTAYRTSRIRKHWSVHS